MDDQMNQGMPGSIPQEPIGGMGPMGAGMTPPPPPGGATNPEDPHEKIMASLVRIEGKLDAIAAKVGA